MAAKDDAAVQQRLRGQPQAAGQSKSVYRVNQSMDQIKRTRLPEKHLQDLLKEAADVRSARIEQFTRLAQQHTDIYETFQQLLRNGAGKYGDALIAPATKINHARVELAWTTYLRVFANVSDINLIYHIDVVTHFFAGFLYHYIFCAFWSADRRPPADAFLPSDAAPPAVVHGRVLMERKAPICAVTLTTLTKRFASLCRVNAHDGKGNYVGVVSMDKEGLRTRIFNTAKTRKPLSLSFSSTSLSLTQT